MVAPANAEARMTELATEHHVLSSKDSQYDDVVGLAAFTTAWRYAAVYLFAFALLGLNILPKMIDQGVVVYLISQCAAAGAVYAVRRIV